MQNTIEQEAGDRGWALSPWMIGVSALLLGVALWWGGDMLAAPVAFGQAEAPAAAANEVTPDEVNTVAREIWCPLCSGVRLDACELKACEQMKDVIAIKLSEGEDAASIKAYFVEQYGPQVLGEPPREGFNWLAWILPVVAVVIGGYFFWRTTRRMMQPAPRLGADGGVLDTMPAPDLSSPTVSPSAMPQSTVSRPPALDEDDEYQQKLDEELAKYG